MVTFFALARLNMNMGFWVLSGIGLVSNLWMACGGRMYYRDHFASLMVRCVPLVGMNRAVCMSVS